MRFLIDTNIIIYSLKNAENMILVTHNTKHFEKIPNLRIQDWF